jgi:hypothetical protein
MLRTYHLVYVTGGHGPPFSYPSRPSSVSGPSFDSTRAVRSNVYIPPPLPPLPEDHQPQSSSRDVTGVVGSARWGLDCFSDKRLLPQSSSSIIHVSTLPDTRHTTKSR